MRSRGFTMPLESTITDTIMTNLKKIPNSFAFKVHGNAMQKKGIPDILFWVWTGMPHLEDESKAFGFEVKRPGEEATPIQAKMIFRLNSAGCRSCVVYSWDDVKTILKAEYIDLKGNKK